MPRLPEATPFEISDLAGCCAVFVPGDPARTGRVAFWRADGGTVQLAAAGSAEEAAVEDLTVALPGDDGVELVSVPAVLLPVRAALPVLTRARASAQAHRAGVFWGTAAVLALQLVARGLLLPGLSADDHDAWRAGPLQPEDVERVRALAAAMPPEAHAVPLGDVEPLMLPDPERLLRAFLDAVTDALPAPPPRSSSQAVPPTRPRSRSACPNSAHGQPMSPQATTRAYGSPCGSKCPASAGRRRMTGHCRSGLFCSCTA